MEAINSFFSNIRDKITNPFFGTLIVILIIEHWTLWFSLFNFDEHFNLRDKLSFVNEYISHNLTLSSFVRNVLTAFTVMIIGYLIVLITRSLTMFFEYRIMPWVTKSVVHKKVVDKRLYDEAVEEREEYFDKYEEQRKNVRNFSKTLDAQVEQIKENDKTIVSQSDQINKMSRNLEEADRKFKDKKRELQQATESLNRSQEELQQLGRELEVKRDIIKNYENLFFRDQSREFFNSLEKFPPGVTDKYIEIKKKNLWNTFIAAGQFYDKGGHISGKVFEDLQKIGICYPRGQREEFTPVGKILWEYRNIFNISS